MSPTTPQPRTTEPYHAGEERTTPWATAVAELAGAGTYFLATLHPAGRAHLVPVLAVVLGGVAHFVADPSSRKRRNLDASPAASLSAHGESLDLVVEGMVRPVTDGEVLRRAATAYAEKYGWKVEIRDGAFHAEGAPTAGPGPYVLHELTPRVAYGFPAGDWRPPTRWRF